MKLINKIARFLKSSGGPTAVEYAVILALIILVCITAIMMVGQQTNASLSNSSNEIQSAFGGGK